MGIFLDHPASLIKLDIFLNFQNIFFSIGMHNTTMYSTYSLFNLNVCYVCGSYQCPYCPFFNVGTVIKASFTLVTLIIGFILQRYMLRNS